MKYVDICLPTLKYVSELKGWEYCCYYLTVTVPGSLMILKGSAI